MKYCNNCQAYRESWDDRLSNGQHDRCWICDSHSLLSNNNSVSLPSASYLIDRNQVQRLVNEIERGQRSEFTQRNEGYDRNTGEYRCEILQYSKGGEYNFTIETRRNF